MDSYRRRPACSDPKACSFRLALSLLLLVPGCAGPSRVSSVTTPLARGSDASPGWPYGESGTGPLIHLPDRSEDPDYGWSPDQPVQLGTRGRILDDVTAESVEMRYLSSLWGPGGEVILYEKVGTCCPFDWPAAPLGKGVLDVFEMRWEGLQEPRHIYLDTWRVARVLIPMGLTCRVPPPQRVPGEPGLHRPPREVSSNSGNTNDPGRYHAHDWTS